jgi:hypothetical protein
MLDLRRVGWSIGYKLEKFYCCEIAGCLNARVDIIRGPLWYKQCMGLHTVSTLYLNYDTVHHI